MKISNNLVMSLLVVAVVLTLAGTLINMGFIGGVSGNQITGQVTTNSTAGTSTITITSQTVITNQVPSIAFGSGYVNNTIACSECVMDTITGVYAGNDTCCDVFNNVTAGFLLENTGNENLTLNMSCSGSCTAATFIGAGTSPLFQFKAVNLSDSVNQSGDTVTDTLGSCSSGGGYNISDWTNLAVGGFDLCGGNGSTKYYMDFVDTRDAVRIDIKVSIPSDVVVTGSLKTATFVFDGTSSG
ncbi:MAG: hypothetical protein ABIH82_05575 [Candidatus Woesearchaeota archaeon]